MLNILSRLPIVAERVCVWHIQIGYATSIMTFFQKKSLQTWVWEYFVNTGTHTHKIFTNSIFMSEYNF